MDGTGSGRQERLKPGRKPSEEKRLAIMKAAAALFAASGVDAATTREIAAAAATTERTLFKHFGSKDGLVRAVIEHLSIQTVREISYGRIHDPRPFTRAEFAAWHRAFLTERVEATERAPDNYRVLFRELFRDDGFRRRYGEHWVAGVFEPLARHLATMQANGEIGRANGPAALAGLFFSLALGYLVSRYALAPEREWTTQADVAAMVTLFATAYGEGGPAG